VGLFATTVAGTALAARLLCIDWKPGTEDLLATRHSSLAPKPTLGIPEGPYLERISKEGLAHFSQTVARLEAAGLAVKPVAALADFEAIYTRHNLLVAAEAAQIHMDWFSQFGELYHWKTAELIQRGQRVTEEELAGARNGRLQLRQELMTLMAEHDLDLWISPPALGAAPEGLDSTGDPVMNLPWTHAGLPTLTIPAGSNTIGLPLGLQVTGHWFEDELLMVQGRMIERALHN
jgi:Asp-tRNA(Asn)/Glu-tRNA(Gln) amidotransferase A subunit family amidase